VCVCPSHGTHAQAVTVTAATAAVEKEISDQITLATNLSFDSVRGNEARKSTLPAETAGKS
jgi:hypothetical protein